MQQKKNPEHDGGFCDVFKISWTDLTENTNIGGIWNSYKERNVARRVLFYVLVLAGFIVTGFMLKTLVLSFLEYPYYNQITIALEKSVAFPAITICNLNRVNCGKLKVLFDTISKEEDSRRRTMIMTLWSASKCGKLYAGPPSGKDESQAGQSTKPPQAGQRRKRAAPPPPRDVTDDERKSAAGGMSGTPNSAYQDELSFLSQLLDLNGNDKKAIGHQYDDMFFNCYYNNIDCLNSSYFFHHYNSIYGNCFIFNQNMTSKFGDTSAGKRFMSMTGTKNSFEVILTIEKDKYMPTSFSGSSGAKIVIHPPDKIPQPNIDGVNVKPGTSTSIAITADVHKTLANPYDTNCTNSWDDTNYSLYLEGRYSQTQCLEYCIQERVMEYCECYHPFYSNHFQSTRVNTTDYKTCAYEQYDCTLNVIAMYQDETITCDCYPPCSELTYTMEVSDTTWPSDNYMLYGDGAPGDLDPSDPSGLKKIQENYLQVRIYFKSLQSQTTTETETYADMWSYLSGLGGTLSLLMGVTILAVLEVLEAIICFFCRFFGFMCGCYRPQKKQDEDQMSAATVYPVLPTSKGAKFMDNIKGNGVMDLT